MAYSPGDLTPSPNGLAFVRGHPTMFRHLAHDGPSAAALLAEGAMRGGADWVEVGRHGGSYYIGADIDWLAGVTPRDAFTELVPFPALGPNAIHPEVVVAAFSDRLLTIADRESRWVVGDMPDLRPPATRRVAGRVIVFDLRPSPK